MSVSELTATRSHEEEAGVSSGLHEVELSSTEKLQRRQAAIFSLGIPSSILSGGSSRVSKCHISLFVALPLPPYVRALFQKIPGEMRAHKFRPI